MPLLAEITNQPGFWEQLGFQAAGILVVMLALATLWITVTSIGRVFTAGASAARKQAARAVPATAATTPESAAQPADGQVPAETIAVIAAAVAIACERPVRIVTVAPTEESRAWSAEGRREHVHSHRVR